MYRKTWLAALLGLIALAGTAWGSGFHTGEFYTSYIGQGLAGVTLLDSAGTVASLPAGMVRLEEGIHALGGVTRYEPKFNYTTADGSESGSSHISPILGPHLYGAYNLGRFAVGLGQYFPFNVAMEYNEDWAGKGQLTKEELIVGYTDVAGAFAINEQMSVGASVHFIYSWMQLKQQVEVTPTVNIPLELGGTADTIGYSLSFLYDTEHWAVGVNHSPKYTLHGSGTANFDTSQVPPALAANFPDGNVKLDLLMPSVTEAAVSIKDRRTDPDYQAEFTVVQMGWSNYNKLAIEFETGKPQPVQVQEKNWKDTIGYRLGGNYAFSRSGDTVQRVRAGIYLDPSPIPAKTLDPAVPDGKGRTDYAVGYGYKNGPLAVDVAYFYIDFKKSTATNPEFPATYKGHVAISSVSVGYGW